LVAALTSLSLLFGAGVGIGILLIISGLRGQAIFGGDGGEDGRGKRRTVTTGNNGRRWLLALTIGVVLWLVTGWLAVGVLVLFVALLLPRMFGGQGVRKEYLEKSNAIATWTEMLRDTMAAADGVEEAIAATVPIAPEQIRREVGLLDARRRSEHSLTDALGAFGAEIDHPSADLVVGALTMAAQGEGSDFVGVLTRLSSVTRDEMHMRHQVEASRSQLHTATRVITLVLIGTLLLLFLLAPGFLEPYASSFGQFWLIVVGGIITIGIVMLDRMSEIEMPERFTPRRVAPRQGAPT
jgi:Flp pilus assembly protein TadB